MPADESTGLELGAALGAAAKAGRDKLTLVISPEIASFGSWIEQLVAESSGKDGKGIVPVDLEPVGRPRGVRPRSPVRLHPFRRRRRASRTRPSRRWSAPGFPSCISPSTRAEDLGREIVRWEVATAIAGATLGVNPFDEPNVTEAKVATSALLAAHAGDGRLPARPRSLRAPRDAERIRAQLATANARRLHRAVRIFRCAHRPATRC